MMLYDDSVEVLEALGWSAALGDQDWAYGYHVEDLLALADALYMAQREPVKWKSQVMGDPFGREFEARARELLIKPVKHGPQARWVKPSYLTWKPVTDYLEAKVLEFFWQELPEDYRVYPLSLRRDRGGVELVHAQGFVLCKLTQWHAYEDASHVKAALMRALVRGCEVVWERRLMSSWPGVNERHYFHHVTQYLDRLWGSEPQSMMRLH